MPNVKRLRGCESEGYGEALLRQNQNTALSNDGGVFSDANDIPCDEFFLLDTLNLALRAARQRLNRLYMKIQTEKEKELWREQVVLLADLFLKNEEIRDEILKRKAI